MAFHYIPENVKAIMGILAESHPKRFSADELVSRASIARLAAELDYCRDKGWVKQVNDKWVATSKGIAAYREMRQGKPCFEISN
ncbi:hypothetical protein ES703_83680 [subsurface metagenome]